MKKEEDFEDQEIASLLRDFARSVRERELRGEPALVPRPAALSRLENKLDEVDSTLGGGRRSLLLRWPSLFAVAASLLVVAGVWWTSSRPGDAHLLAIADLRLLSSPALTRSAPETRFVSGQSVWITFEADSPGYAAVALLDSRLMFDVVRDEKGHINVRELVAGENVLGGIGGYRLDEYSGTETFVVVTSIEALRASELHDLVSEARAKVDAIVSQGGVPHEEVLDIVLAHLGSKESVSLAAITFEHLPGL